MLAPVRKIRTFIRLSPADRTPALAALTLMAMVRVALWRLPFRWVRRTVEGCGTTRLAQERLTELQVAWAVRLASRYIPRATCLTQAVTAQMLLNWAGLESRMFIGVRTDKSFEAHAWVEGSRGVLIGGTEDLSRFTPMLMLRRHY